MYKPTTKRWEKWENVGNLKIREYHCVKSGSLIIKTNKRHSNQTDQLKM